MALVVAAGHAAKGGGEIKADNAEEGKKPRTILKMLDEAELKIYQSLVQTYPSDPIQEFIPRFEGVVEEEVENKSAEPQRFIRISNLLYDFQDPKVMDVKIGVRTFAESECSSKKPRPDLYERMVKMYPEKLTDKEKEEKAITKHKWMTTRDSCSTIRELGYRIDGIAGYRSKNRKEIEDEIAAMRTRADTCAAFIGFCDVASTDDGEALETSLTATLNIAEQLRSQLRGLRAAAEESPFISDHEFIGTSLLFVADASGTAQVSWIDFAKTTPLEEGMQITHCKAWEQGNHEDGVITGLDNLVETFDKVVSTLKAPGSLSVEASFWLSERPSRPAKEKTCCWLCRRKRPARRKTKGDTTDELGDVGILSMVPAFAGTVADAKTGQIWGGGVALAKMRTGVLAMKNVASWAAEGAAEIVAGGKVRRQSQQPDKAAIQGDARSVEAVKSEQSSVPATSPRQSKESTEPEQEEAPKSIKDGESVFPKIIKDTVVEI